MVTCRYSVTLLPLASVIVFLATSTTIAADLPVDFTLSLKVDKLNKNSYLYFIAILHKNLASLPGASEIFGIPVLPPQPPSPPLAPSQPVLPSPGQGLHRWFHLELEASGAKTTVRVCGNTLDIVGYKMQDTETWLEFTRPKAYIDGSQDLGFGDEYQNLEAASLQKYYDILLTKETLIESVYDLASSFETEKRAQALIIVSLMICEASRFNDIAMYFAEQLNRNDVKLREWIMQDLISMWVEFSNDVLCHYKYGREYKYEPKMIDSDEIETVYELCTRLSLILRTHRYEKDLCNLRLPREEQLSVASVHPSH